MSESMWTNGHSLILQDPGWVVTHLGYGVNVVPAAGDDSAGVQNWVHFPISTQTVTGGQRVEANTVHLRFQTGPQATVIAVNAYDGERMILNQSGLSISNSTLQSTPGRS